MTSEVVFPEELDFVVVKTTCSLAQILILLESKETLEGIEFWGSFLVLKKDDTVLKNISQALASKSTVKHLRFSKFDVMSSLMAETLRDVIASNFIRKLEFERVLMKKEYTRIICQAFQERTTPLQLSLHDSSPEFVNEIIKASVVNCFSLSLDKLNSEDLERPLKKLFTRGFLCCLRITRVSGLKDSTFLHLSRCIPMMPGLKVLSFMNTIVSISGMKHLYGTMKGILDSGRSRIFEVLYLGLNFMHDQLTYSYLKLLESDAIASFGIRSSSLSRAVKKHIASAVCNTKNLKNVSLGTSISSGTKFRSFILQTKGSLFFGPFGINLRT